MRESISDMKTRHSQELSEATIRELQKKSYEMERSLRHYDGAVSHFILNKLSVESMPYLALLPLKAP